MCAPEGKVAHRIQACLRLTQAISATRTVDDVFAAALDALGDALGVERASILLCDPDGVMRFKAWRGISAEYRRAVEGHTPWDPASEDPEPIVIADVLQDPALSAFQETFQREGIRALAFIPLVVQHRLLGKFMLYYDAPTTLESEAIELAGVLAAQVAFAVERMRAEERAHLSAEWLRFALDAAMMGTWDWDLKAGTVRWSENLERIHGLPPGSFDGTFESYVREIHPDDRERVLASVSRALAGEGDHDVEYRLVAPDGTVRWAEGKGRVHYVNGEPVRMSGVCMIVTPRKEAEFARLEAAHEAARLKDEFLATLSHELRTPLNAILGWVQIVESGMMTPDRLRDALKVIGRNARMQAQLIEDILDVSRIISGKLEIEVAPMSLKPLIDAAVSTAVPAALAGGIELSADVPGTLPPINGDADRLQQVLGNILSNAIKFSESGGRVILRASADAQLVAIEVADNGIGIPRDFLPFVFERFRQADSRSTRRHGGLGLGLAIARHIVDLHGGTIEVDSRGQGHGTCIRLTLPTASVEEEPKPQPLVQIERRLDGVRVLVVDDHDDTRELLRTLFESAGAAVDPAGSAQAGLAIAVTAVPDLLVADIGMPDVDGYSFLRAFRDRHPQVPAIAVTAYARAEDASRARAAGFDGYHAKPIVAPELVRLAAEVVRRRPSLA
jgi:PAS domain S-box-containing protein